MAVWFLSLLRGIAGPNMMLASSPTYGKERHVEGPSASPNLSCILPTATEVGFFTGWSDRRKGLEVKVSQEHILTTSHHSGITHALVYGTVVAKYLEALTKAPMFIVDFGGGDRPI
jgi:hypothetical protein